MKKWDSRPAFIQKEIGAGVGKGRSSSTRVGGMDESQKKKLEWGSCLAF